MKLAQHHFKELIIDIVGLHNANPIMTLISVPPCKHAEFPAFDWFLLLFGTWRMQLVLQTQEEQHRSGLWNESGCEAAGKLLQHH